MNTYPLSLRRLTMSDLNATIIADVQPKTKFEIHKEKIAAFSQKHKRKIQVIAAASTTIVVGGIAAALLSNNSEDDENDEIDYENYDFYLIASDDADLIPEALDAVNADYINLDADEESTTEETSVESE